MQFAGRLAQIEQYVSLDHKQGHTLKFNFQKKVKF